jgi:hypothetical protein
MFDSRDQAPSNEGGVPVLSRPHRSGRRLHDLFHYLWRPRRIASASKGPNRLAGTYTPDGNRNRTPVPGSSNAPVSRSKPSARS